MDDFLTWPGWAGVSGIAQLVALVTLFGAAWRFILQRRQAPLFAVDWTILGHRVVEDGSRYHLVEFRNTGRGSAEIHLMEFFGAQVRLEDGYLVPGVVMPGGSFRLLLTSPRIVDVWFRLTWRTPDSRRRATIAWWPLVEKGDLNDKWTAAADSRWRRLRQALFPRPVAPERELRAVYRGWPGQSIHALYSLPKGGAIYSLGTNHNFSPTDLPYIPRPERK